MILAAWTIKGLIQGDLVKWGWIIIIAVFFYVIFKRLSEEANKKQGPQKNDNRYWNEYIDRIQKRSYQKGTTIGKTAVKEFVRGLTIRVNGDIKDKESFNAGIHQKYAVCQFYFYKWLAEIYEFEPDANERINVPVMTFFKTQHSNFRYLANTTGPEHFRHTHNLKQLNDAVRYLKAMRHKHLKQRVKGGLN